jgi:hypothetical protein
VGADLGRRLVEERSLGGAPEAEPILSAALQEELAVVVAVAAVVEAAAEELSSLTGLRTAAGRSWWRR